MTNHFLTLTIMLFMKESYALSFFSRSGKISKLIEDRLIEEEDESINVLKCFEDDEITPNFIMPSNGNKVSKGIIIIDNFSPYHGDYLTIKAREDYNLGIVQVLSPYLTGYLYQEEGETGHLPSRMPLECHLNAWKSKIPFEIEAIYCESDSGLFSSEWLGDKLNVVKHNGKPNPARRDKFLLNELVKLHGNLPTVKQQLCSTWEEAHDFAVNELNLLEENNSCIAKPRRGVASDNVFRCYTVQELHKAYHKISDSSLFGSMKQREQNQILLQEYLQGTEYAVDIVSRNGQHKMAALWKYDKRLVNNAPFVYFATKLVDAADRIGQLILSYVSRVLDILDINWGLCHVEVMVLDYDVRLIEVNCRQHNTDFVPLTDCCIGYNAMDMLLMSYFDQDTWETIPALPNIRTNGAVIHLVSFVEGIIQDFYGLDIIENLESVQYQKIYKEIGNFIEKTVDIRTDAGFIHLINDNEDTFQKDYRIIVDLMPHMFIVE